VQVPGGSAPEPIIDRRPQRQLNADLAALTQRRGYVVKVLDDFVDELAVLAKGLIQELARQVECSSESLRYSSGAKRSRRVEQRGVAPDESLREVFDPVRLT
jgi:hypothetical protein